jgi:hypothetical protein
MQHKDKRKQTFRKNCYKATDKETVPSELMTDKREKEF